LIAAVLVVLYVSFGRDHQAAVTTPTPAASPQASPSHAAGVVGDCPVQGCSPSRSAPGDRRVGATTPNLLWKAVLSPGVRGLVASGNHLYATDGATLYALDLSTGLKQWSASLGVPAGIAGASPPVVSAGVVYIAASDGTVFAFSASDGKRLWSRALREPVVTSVAVEDGLVYAGTVPGYLHALNAATGDESWEFATGPIKNSSPVIVDGIVYIGGGDNKLFALEAATGKQLWLREVGAGMKSVAVGANLALVASRGTGAFVSFTALSTTDASQVWLKPLTIDLTPAIIGQTVYVSEDGAIIAALDSQMGAERWRFSATLAVVDLAVTTDTALVLRKDGAAIALDNTSGKERWRVATGLNATSLAVGAGVFYAAHKDGTVTAYGTPSS
jgi:outer membrane protein assembly factor BamB